MEPARSSVLGTEMNLRLFVRLAVRNPNLRPRVSPFCVGANAVSLLLLAAGSPVDIATVLGSLPKGL